MNFSVSYDNLYNKHMKPVLGNSRMRDIRERHLQGILSGMAETYSVKTVEAVRKIMFSVFDKARSNNLIAINPAEHLDAQGRPQKERRALTIEERKAYLAACEKHSFGDFAAFLYFFLPAAQGMPGAERTRPAQGAY